MLRRYPKSLERPSVRPPVAKVGRRELAAFAKEASVDVSKAGRSCFAGTAFCLRCFQVGFVFSGGYRGLFSWFLSLVFHGL